VPAGTSIWKRSPDVDRPLTDGEVLPAGQSLQPEGRVIELGLDGVVGFDLEDQVDAAGEVEPERDPLLDQCEDGRSDHGHDDDDAPDDLAVHGRLR
jgi:hypothetical protein